MATLEASAKSKNTLVVTLTSKSTFSTAELVRAWTMIVDLKGLVEMEREVKNGR